MKKILIGVMLMFVSSLAMASNCSDIRVAGLPAKQLTELRIQCEQAKLVNIEQPSGMIIDRITPERVSEWSDIAGSFTNAIGTAASRIGVSVNEFMKTPAGYLTVAIIVWKIAGSEIIALLLCSLYMYISFKIIGRLWSNGDTIINKSFGPFKWQKMKPQYNSYIDQPDSCVFFTLVIFASNAVMVMFAIFNV
jgi:hypothetical protein